MGTSEKLFVLRGGRLFRFGVGYFGAEICRRGHLPASMTTLEFVVENGGAPGLRVPATWDMMFQEREVPRPVCKVRRSWWSNARQVQADRDRRAQRREKRVQQEVFLK